LRSGVNWDREDAGGAEEFLGCCYTGEGLEGGDGWGKKGEEVHGGVFPDCGAEFFLDIADAVSGVILAFW
jgi:hypothetical protein